MCDVIHSYESHVKKSVDVLPSFNDVLPDYGVALVSRIEKIIGLFCKRALQKRQYSTIETYNFIDPTDRSHPIPPRLPPADALPDYLLYARPRASHALHFYV